MYKTSKDFDLAMARPFEKARRWQEPGGEAYGRALVLQVSPESTPYPTRNLTGDSVSVPSDYLSQSTFSTLYPFNELFVFAGRTWERQASE
jgi:hypothetical protein